MAPNAMCAMLGAASWQILASVLKMPVSGTHSIVGAIVGFHVAAKGWDGIAWKKMAKIVMSWFLSPVLAGLMSVFLFWLLHVNVIIPAQSVQETGMGEMCVDDMVRCVVVVTAWSLQAVLILYFQ